MRVLHTVPVVPGEHPMLTEHFKKYPQIYGEYRAYDGCKGTILCGAGAEGVYVRFDGFPGYTGVATANLTRLEEE